MKTVSLFLLAATLVGCAGRHPGGVSKLDEFDAVQVDQMVGNNVSSAPLQKVIVCLNARRETRQVTAITNVSIVTVTNASVVAVTNEIISIATNYLVTTMTNLAPQVGGAPGGPVSDEAAAAAAATVTPAAGDAAALAALTNSAPQLTTNVTVSVARNSTATAGPSQRGANHQVVRTYNNQITTQSNNLSVSLMTNLVVTAETNATVSYVTNFSLASVTNITITATNLAVHDYYLVTEMVPPPDFTIQSGESLTLLVDGARHALATTTPGAALVSRRGFTTTVYRASPELLVALANDREVRLRLKGSGNVLERTLSDRSRQNFKAFLVRFFSSPEPDTDPARPPEKQAAVSGTTHEVADAR